MSSSFDIKLIFPYTLESAYELTVLVSICSRDVFINFIFILGTLEERGISAWQVSDEDEWKPVDKNVYNEGYEVYSPLVPKRLLNSKLTKYIPFLPYKKTAVVDDELNNTHIWIIDDILFDVHCNDDKVLSVCDRDINYEQINNIIWDNLVFLGLPNKYILENSFQFLHDLDSE